MPTEHKKKKAKKEKTTPSIMVKSEPSELHPLEHYVDDRVELVRQIFSSMKTKTINSIVPDFLQKKSHEELQEICLEELLGISKKRLISIINASKCPSDTESSDSDASDVENIEEHISLEEISSDSNDELNKPKKVKKNASKSMKKTATSAATAKATSTAKSTEQNAPATGANGKPEGEKQYSILELLELQARARAIRSQLALEPVTKIELNDSDDEAMEESNDPNSTQPPKDVAENDKNKAQDDATEPVANIATNKEALAPVKPAVESAEQPRVPSSRPIRLKRNFRARQMDEEDVPAPTPGDAENVEKEVEKKAEKDADNSKTESPEKGGENANDAVAITGEDGDGSKAAIADEEVKDDDIIPIIAEPEILCITSSDSENEDTKFLNKVKRSYITMPTVEKEARPPTEDELFLEKVKQKTSIEAVLKQSTEKAGDERPTKAEGSAEATKAEEEPPEDGEIVEDEPVDETTVESDIVNLAESSDEESESVAKSTEIVAEKCKSEILEEEESNGKSSRGRSSGKDSDGADDTDDENSVELGCSKDGEQSKRSDDEDEDIIDLGKDEDLDFEIKNDGNSEPKNESWDTRWLRNNKVSKVLATAKLQSKVRSKIKEKKTKTATEVVRKEESNETAAKPPAETPTNVEVGSVEHYKELTKTK